MNQHAEEVETLILGNSHTAEGIIPTLFKKKSFSLAIPGQPYLYCRFLFFKWANRCKDLKVLILPVSYSSFYEEDNGIEADMAHLYYGIYMDSPFHKYELRYNLESLYYKSFEKLIMNCLRGNKINWKPDGWIPWLLVNKTSVWNAEHVNKSLARLLHAKSYNEVNRNFQYVANIADYCFQHDIRVVLVSTPHTKEYNACLDSQQIAYTRSLVEILQKQYAVEYYDYREDNRFTDNDFYDQSHLSDIGANKFSKILITDISLYETFNHFYTDL